MKSIYLAAQAIRLLFIAATMAMVTGTFANAQSATMKSYTADGFSIYLPADWQVRTNQRSNALDGKAPDGKANLMVWWWFPDEPLLGYPDIIAHKKITTAGQPALYIRTRTGGRESLSITFDKARKDRKRLRVMFETQALMSPADVALFEAMISSMTLGPKPHSSNTSTPAFTPAAAPKALLADAGRKGVSPSGKRALPSGKITSSRRWLGPVSFEAPEQWTVSSEADRRVAVLKRPDGKAEIMIVLWPLARPMPSRDVEKMEFITLGGAPAQRYRIRSGANTVDHLFFDEPFGDGSRLSVLYKVTGEPIEDGLPLFELVLASLDRTLTPPSGAWRPPLATGRN